MKNSNLTAKLASLLEDENPLVSYLILETVNEVETKSISVEAHSRNIERKLDLKLQQMGGEKE